VCGTFGDISTFFNGSKVITTSGADIITSSLALKKKAIFSNLREEAPHYQHIEIGNYRKQYLC
jgi:dTDP-4-amino-4,6-dideoxygalactose transaminase